VFVEHDDGTVTAVVQIQYSGPAERFSWVLPVPGTPDVELSSDIAFQRLQAFSNPSYRLNTTVEGECADDFRAFASFADAGVAIDFGAADAGPTGPPVTVLAHANVGPYVYDVIQLNPELESPGDAAVAWLELNGYDVSGLGGSTLGSYLLDGMNLIAFKLEKGNSAGTIRPVRLRFEASCPMIPIRPTAVAATPDMGVMVWVVGPARAVPTNYLSLELNEAALDWTRGAPNYNAVVTQAANEAGGQGFVTEHAVPASAYRDVVYRPDSAFTSFGWESDPLEELLSQILARYGTWDGTSELIRDLFVDEVSIADVSDCLFFGFEPCDLNTLGTLRPFGSEERALLRARFVDEVIDPVRETNALFAEGAYVTRLYTTLSAAEMTLDPTFDFNPDLPDVSNQHVAERVVRCSPSLLRSEAPWTAVLPNGQRVHGSGNGWPVDPSATPALKVATRLTTRGTGEVVIDNESRIELPPSPAVDLRPSRGTCSVGQAGAGSPGWLVGALYGVCAGLLRGRRRLD
jgi:hypothetical protein